MKLIYDGKKSLKPQGKPAAGAAPLETCSKLEAQCRRCIANGDMKGYKDPYSDLWDLFEENKNDPERSKLASSLAGLIYEHGLYHHEHFHFLGLCGSYNDARDLAEAVPTLPDAALTCMQLAMGIFEMKFQMHEFENVESYIDELLPISERFAQDENFSMQSAATLCNLLQLCPYDRSVFLSRMREILEQIEALAARIPKNAELQLCCLRAMVFYLCYGKPRLKDEIFQQVYERTRAALAANRDIIPAEAFFELRHTLRQNDIAI